ncbi:glutathione S-transferase, partial [Enterococcus hirae]
KSAPAGNDYGVRRYVEESRRLLGVLEPRLASATSLAGEDYSVADVATFPWGHGMTRLEDFDLEEYPALVRWVEAIAARPAVRKGLEIPG